MEFSNVDILNNGSSFFKKRLSGLANYEFISNTLLQSEKHDCNKTNSSMELTTRTSDGSEELPEEMRFGTQHIVSIAAYSGFFIISAIGNLTVFITLFRNRSRKSRVNMFIMHLTIADLIVTFIMMPLEISWRSTVQWLAGDVACRILMFFRIFGLYLSSFVLVVISLDRYFAIVHPLNMNDADKRGKIMLTIAWLFGVIASIPQSIIFHDDTPPGFPFYHQCVTFNFFPIPSYELVYSLFTMIAMYGLPLVIITISYILILKEICIKTKQSKEELQELNSSSAIWRLRRSAVGNIKRAMSRTMKMTIVIVGAFVFCWTPYYVIAVWWWFDRLLFLFSLDDLGLKSGSMFLKICVDFCIIIFLVECTQYKDSARTIDPKLQNGLFIFAVSNSCVNPIVYGLFTINIKREFSRCCCCLKSVFPHETRTLFKTRYRGDPMSIYSQTSRSLLPSSLEVNGTEKIKMTKIPKRHNITRCNMKNNSMDYEKINDESQRPDWMMECKTDHENIVCKTDRDGLADQ